MGEERQAVEERALAIPDQARALAVRDQETLELAQEFLVGVKRLRKEIGDTFDPVIKKAHEAHKEALAQKKRYEAPLIEGEKIAKSAVADYVDEQERIRREAELKAQREREEAERLKREEEERALAEALEAASDGDEGKANDILDAAEQKAAEPVAPVKTVVPEAPKVGRGVSAKKVWKWRIVDSAKIPREFLVPDEREIGAYLRKTGWEAKIPGVEVYQETSVAARSSRW